MTRFALYAFAALLAVAPATAAEYRAEVVVEGLDAPWALAFLPNGDMLVTELSGQLRRISNGTLIGENIAGVPPVHYAGQGGLMDIVLHPDFAENRLLYLSLARGEPESNALRIVRARFTGTALENVETVFEAAPVKDTSVHYGGRMAFLPDDTLLITVGDGFDYREEAQNLGNHFGTVVRIHDDGKVPSDNPFVDDDAAQPEIWSYGHRNAQSIEYDGATDTVFATEHGARGGDELNIVEAGKNYGWPVITWGVDYSGARISPYREYAGMEQPLVDWTPSIAPSAMTIYRGTQFPAWDGDILVTSLVFRNAVRVDMEGTKVAGSETLFGEFDARLRDIATGPDGAIYLLAEGESGRLIRITPQR